MKAERLRPIGVRQALDGVRRAAAVAGRPSQTGLLGSGADE